MKFYSVRESDITNIADAIRTKTGKTDGMTPTQMSDEIASIPERMEAEEVTVPLNMADGDMTVSPTDGKAISKATIQKPETLVPENIAKDVDIAGVVGTHEGGGEISPCLFTVIKRQTEQGYVYSNTAITSGTAITLAAGSVIHSTFGSCASDWSSSATMVRKTNDTLSARNGLNFGYCKITNNADGSITVTPTSFMGIEKYYMYYFVLVVLFSVPGIYCKRNADGTIDIFTDEDVATTPTGFITESYIGTLDLSKSKIQSLPSGFTSNMSVKAIKMPSTLKTLIYSVQCNDIREIDMSLCTSVPTFTGSISKTYLERILVPSALYDEWIAATNWANYAEYIVAV